MSLYVTSAPSMDNTIRTSLPREVRIVPRIHKALFYQGGLVVRVAALFPSPPTAYF